MGKFSDIKVSLIANVAAFKAAFKRAEKALAWFAKVVETGCDFEADKLAIHLTSYNLLWGHDGARCLASKQGHRPDPHSWPLWN